MKALHNVAAKAAATIIIEIVCKLVVKRSSALRRVGRLLPLSRVIVLYIIFDIQLIQLTVLSLRVNGFASITQSKSLADVSGPLSVPTE